MRETVLIGSRNGGET